MRKTILTKVLSVILCCVLIAATALFTIGCSNNETNGDKENPETSAAADNEADDGDQGVTGEATSGDLEVGAKVLGEGAKKFDFFVETLDGQKTFFVIKTDKEIVGEALLDLNLIEGEAGPYGLYVKKVNGIVADYDKDKTYWGFYVDGEYAMTGVDMTKIEEGKTYSFKVSK